jgi:type IV pilus assembly protein PilE
MNTANTQSGFTIVELMVVVAIIAVITALAYPAYSGYVRHANRGEAQQLLMSWSVNQEIWRSNHTSYANDSDLPKPTHSKFTFSIPVRSGTAYTLRAVGKDDQAKDKEGDTSCATLEINQSGGKSPAVCWD